MNSQTVLHVAKHIKEFYFGKNWTWVNLQEHLADITWQEANAKVGSANTIVALTYHIHYYVASVMSVLKGGPVLGTDVDSFKHPEIDSQESWVAFQNKIYNEAREFITLVEGLDESLLWKTFYEEKYGDHFRNLQGFTEHGFYHLGQIVLLKKLIRERK